MGATFFDLMKCAKTGIASDDMTDFDNAKALALLESKFPVNTITGVPPLSFKSDGTELTDWSITGASGGVGDATANLFNEVYPNLNTTIKYIPIQVGDGTFTLSTDIEGTLKSDCCLFFLAGNVDSGANYSANGCISGTSRTVTSSGGYVTIGYRLWGTGNPSTAHTMLNAGDSALPYEKYGYKIPITLAGNTQNAYIAAQLGASDSISMSDTGITLVPEKGSNTLSIGTTVQPASVSITGGIKP